MGVEVRGKPEVQSRPAGQQTRGQIERDAVDEVAQHQAAARIAMGDQGQRRQEVLAELTVGGPWLGWRRHLEGERIDEDRPAAVELDVVGARVLEPHPGVEGPRLDLEGEEGRLLQLGERPLVGIRDEVEEPRPDDGHRPGARRVGERHLLVIDQ